MGPLGGGEALKLDAISRRLVTKIRAAAKRRWGATVMQSCSFHNTIQRRGLPHAATRGRQPLGGRGRNEGEEDAATRDRGLRREREFILSFEL